jgi:TRAP-type mannitol/chloroaromatic compound transport system substrate-binding protein|tara:strand:- start:3214 stop:4398 length:1185 start_codon:yes stop_codon:yes gene_type:complete
VVEPKAFAVRSIERRQNNGGFEMFSIKKVTKITTAMTVCLSLSAGMGLAERTLRLQTVISANADEVVMLQDFAADVTALTDGEIKFEILPAGSVVGVNETLDAVDSGLLDGGFAWTHYWSGKHPAAMLFGSPVAGAGVGIDNIAFLSWFQYGGGQELYDRLWDEMGVNIKGFMLQPVGPEALGWFKEPINSMADFQKYRFRAPPGIPGQTYKDIGVASVAMGGGDILPALEKGTIDAAEWCCPKPDSVFGFQKVLKHYYLQGLHQVVVNADLYLNKDVYNSLTPLQQKAIQVAANASLSKSMSYRIYENGKALKDLTENQGVILHDTPADYFPAYMNAAKAALEKNAEENAFFAEVWQSQKDFAEIAVPYWAGSQASNAALGKAFADQVAARLK